MPTAETSALRIGALARACALSPDSLRHYERLGLLPTLPRTRGGFRQYPAVALRRIRVIQAALAIGFTLDELRQIFRERAAGRAPCARVLDLAEHKLAELEAELLRLAQLRDALRGVIRDWRTRKQSAPPGQPAGLLDALADHGLVDERESPLRAARIRRSGGAKTMKGRRR
jgi:DNA-binding transcriptional MerR regulator